MQALPADSPERVRHFKQFVIQFLNGIKDTDGTLVELLRVAWPYPNDVLELACGKWRAVVMKDAHITEDVMRKLCKTVETQKLLANYRSPEYMRCVGECAVIMMDTLDSTPGVLQEIMAVFSPGVVYATLTTHRTQFMHRFGTIIDPSELKVSVQFWLVDTLRRRLRKKPGHILRSCIRKTIRVRMSKLKFL
jgi:hypothetical protein